MSIQLPYGSSRLDFQLESEGGLGVLELGRQPTVDPVSATLSALRHPLDSPPLTQLVQAGDKVTILTSDSTRVVQANLFMPVILDELNSSGVPDRNITILFARGNHRALSEDEVVTLLGKAVTDRVRTTQHDSHNEADLVLLGRTIRGTEVWVNRLAIDCNLLIITGAVQFHDFAGFSGGCKSILPGISGHQTIQQNHRLLLYPVPGCGRNPHAVSGKLDGNPVHEDMLEAALMVPRAFMVNSVVTPEGGIAHMFAGSLRNAHHEACRLVSRTFGVSIGQQAELVLVSCGGWPRDINYYQATKAICNAGQAVMDGGVIVLVAECREGLGAEGFPYWFGELRDVAAVDAVLRRSFDVVGYFALMIKELLQSRSVTIIGVTGLGSEEARMVGLEPATSPLDALAKARARLRHGFSWCAIPNGCVTLPIVDQH
ncbi:MAG: nickel-dependent lactate racemase [Firmicutes bacterium]|nr:nickel-dependent lactate racemase [Bacillota bacterium]